MSGIGPVREVFPARKTWRPEDSVRVRGMVHELRGLFSILKDCRLGRPTRKGLPMSEKAFQSR